MADALLDAAVELVRRGGLSALTTETLAAQARVSKTTIYKRFSGKEEILAATLDHLDWRPEVDETGDLREELTDYHRDRGEFFAQRGVARVLAAVMAASAGDRPTRQAVAQHLRRQLSVPQEILQRAHDRGEISDRFRVDTLVTVLCGAAYYRSVIEGKPLDERFLDELVELITTA